MKHRRYAFGYHVIEFTLAAVGLGWSVYWLLNREPQYHLSGG